MKAASFILAIGLGFCGGIIFWLLKLPVPFMLGSLSICWALGGTIPWQRWFGLTPMVPIGFRRLILCVMGVLLGSYLGPDTVADIYTWWDSMLAVVAFIVLSTGSCYLFLKKIRGKDKVVAWFSSLPGGLTEVVALSRQYTDKDYVVLIHHLFRVTAVFFLVPLVLAIVYPDLAVGKSVSPTTIHIIDVGPVWYLRVGLLLGLSIWIANRVHIPMGAMLISLCISSIYHLLGFPPVDRVYEPTILLQVVLGCGFGLRLAEVNMKELRPHFLDAFLATVLTVLVALGLSWISAVWKGDGLLKYFLIFVPGGINEIALLSLVFGYEVAFVTIHHGIRIIVTIVISPYGIRALTAGRNKTRS